MELSPIYEALKRCLYPAIEPLIYTNYRGFNASSPSKRPLYRIELQTRVAPGSVRCVPLARGIFGHGCSLIDTLSAFSSKYAGKLLDSVRIDRVIPP